MDPDDDDADAEVDVAAALEPVGNDVAPRDAEALDVPSDPDGSSWLDAPARDDAELAII